MLIRVLLLLFILLQCFDDVVSQQIQLKSNTPTHSLSVDKDNNSLIAIHNNGSISEYKNGQFVQMPIGNTKSYIGVDQSTLISFDNKYIHSEKDSISRKQLVSDKFDSLYVARHYEGKLWLGTDNGLWVWDQDSIYQADIGSVYNDQKLKILEIFGTDLWYAVGNAAFNWSDNLNPIIANDNITVLYKPKHSSAKNQLLIQTNSGFFIGDSNHLKRLYIPEIGQPVMVCSITENKATIYIADHQLGIIAWNLLDQSYNNVQLPQCAPSEINTILVGPYGGLWIATDRGIYRYTIDKAEENKTPRITITQYKLNGKNVSINKLNNTNLGDVVQLSFETEHWIFNTNIVSEYQTEQNGPWTSVGDAHLIMHKVQLSDQYIQIRSTIDHDTYDYTDPIKLNVEDTSWMIYIYALLSLIAAIFLISLLALNSNKTKITALQKDAQNLRSENKALRHEQKAMQLQMNPHFLFNALNSIQGLISLGESQKARTALKQFSGIMRQVLDQSRVDKILLSNEKSYLQKYLKLEQMIRQDAFDFTINVDEQLSDNWEILPMIVQPFVENAIIHGVAPLKERRGNIVVHFSMMDNHNYICVSISDNGIGIQEKGLTATHQSVATTLAYDRLKAYPEANIKIVDHSESVSQSGVTVEIIMPIFRT